MAIPTMTKEQYVVNHVLNTAEKGNAISILQTIDTLCHSDQQYWLMNIGDDKGVIVDNYIQQQLEQVITSKINTGTTHIPVVMVEVGGYIGYSAIRFATVLQQAIQHQSQRHSIPFPRPIYYSFEVNPEVVRLAQQLFEFAGLDKDIRVVNAAFGETVEQLKQDIHHIDIVFLDHWKDLYLPDIKLIEQHALLIKGSMIIADNTIYPGTPEYLEFIKHQSEKGVYTTQSVVSNLEYKRDQPDALEITIKL